MEEDRKVFLTTADNPYDPYNQFDEWYAYDEQHGYGTCEYLARIARTSPGIPDKDNDIAVEAAIDEIVRFNLLGNYQKIVYVDGKRIN